jgi:hypothetical protein
MSKTPNFHGNVIRPVGTLAMVQRWFRESAECSDGPIEPGVGQSALYMEFPHV